VKIPLFQCMNLCIPPNSFIIFVPGFSDSMNALDIRHSVPMFSSSSGLKFLTFAFVPTGMKNGVFSVPCAVFRWPVLASSHSFSILNMVLCIFCLLIKVFVQKIL